MSIQYIAWLLISMASVLAVYAAAAGLRPLWKVVGTRNNESRPTPSGPKASIVVYTRLDEERIERFINCMSLQDYSDFEVIMICEATAERTEAMAEKFAGAIPNLYFTFIPPGSHNLSRRKLATTIGVKAAKGDVIVTTISNAVCSPSWLSNMMAPFAGPGGEEVEVVLGTSRIKFSDYKGPGKWYRQFDETLSTCRWAGYALAGSPYRGDGYNLAFRRKTFFEHKGYAETINLHNGDDDLFVYEISDSGNTRVVLADEGIVTTEWGDDANRVWDIRKAGYDFTARWLPHVPFLAASLLSACQWLVPALCVAAAWIARPSYIAVAVALVITLTFWGMEIFAYRKAASVLGAVKLWWAVVPFWLWRPLGNMFFRYDHLHSRKKNFTWIRRK
ncbi:MAG: glycosyltransferase [Candidatus Amulumruptor caecigallinarius]|nr:glycosyltransferase [Candidatus Amulumruptor caecigallinarius]